MLTVFPISGGLIILAHELILVVFGAKWIDMASSMQILCVLGVAKCMQGDVVFNSLKRPDIPVRISIIRLTLIALTIYPPTKRFGMEGTFLSVTLPFFLIATILLYYVNKLIGHRPRDYVWLLSLPLVSTLVMMLMVFLVRLSLLSISNRPDIFKLHYNSTSL